MMAGLLSKKHTTHIELSAAAHAAVNRLIADPAASGSSVDPFNNLNESDAASILADMGSKHFGEYGSPSFNHGKNFNPDRPLLVTIVVNARTLDTVMRLVKSDPSPANKMAAYSLLVCIGYQAWNDAPSASSTV